MRPLQQSETAILSELKGKNLKEGEYTRDASEVSIAVLTVVEEAGHSLGQHLMVVRDEALLGATNTFIGEQGVGGEAAEDLQNKILCEAGQCVTVVGAASISKSLRPSLCSRMRASLVMRSLKRKIIQQRSNSEVHNSYQVQL